jgi:ABC-type lipoprotein export system ATPase subunit
VLESVSKVFRSGASEVRAVSEVDAEVREGEIVAIVGPSGSGKTTLLSMAGGLLTPTFGRVLVLGEDLYRWATASARPSACATSGSSSRRSTSCPHSMSARMSRSR